ncbi:MAG: DoxX family membrane protein [Crocinitomicaceae bacterium]|nr:DoxX family membrane protein [Crocinitomicaceae bacterium]
MTSMEPLAALLVRLGLAASMLTHGIVRLPKLTQFADSTVAVYSDTFLPAHVVLFAGYCIPIIQLLTGILLLIGFKTRLTAFAVGLLMILLITGSGLSENWGAMPSQFIHLLFAAILIVFSINPSRYSVDFWLKKRE